jgi:WD40 repeat protein
MQNGAYFISASDDTYIKVWDATLYWLINTITGHTGNVNILEVLSNGQIVSGSSDNTVKIWNQNGTISASFNPFGNSVTCLKEISTGFIAIGGKSTSVYIYSTNGILVYTLSTALSSAQCIDMTIYNKKILAMVHNSPVIVLFNVSSVLAPVSLSSILSNSLGLYSLESLRKFSNIYAFLLKYVKIIAINYK